MSPTRFYSVSSVTTFAFETLRCKVMVAVGFKFRRPSTGKKSSSASFLISQTRDKRNGLVFNL